MENNSDNSLIIETSRSDYLKFSEINANLSNLHDQYLIWLSAGVLSIAFPQILSIINIINSKALFLLLMSAISFIITIIISFINLEVCGKIISYRLKTVDILRTEGKETDETSSNDKKEYCLGKLVNVLSKIIICSFIIGLLSLLIYVSINYKIINIK